MAILDILTYPNPFLTKSVKPVENINEQTNRIIDDMAATMYAAPGVGLAAIQVGFDRSILVYDISPRSEKRSLNVLINPRIISSSGEMLSEDEGCLSVPDFRSNVKRAAKILVEGIDRNGKPVRIEAEGLLAIVLQHEIDHLQGKLFIDRISALKREIYRRHIKKKLREK